jgi:hypothetical protein
MNLLREYVRQLLTEAAKGLDDLIANDAYVTISSDIDDVSVYYSDSTGRNRSDDFGTGVFITKSTEKTGNCDDAWQVDFAKARHGWGPLLYDVAIEYATMNGGGLTSDRIGVSQDARRVWDYYMNSRPDVQSHQLDKLVGEPIEGPQLTPDTADDDCKQASSVRDKTGEKWFDSSSSRRYTKEPTTIDRLRSAGRLIEK